MIAASITQSKDLWYLMRASGLVALLLLTLTMVAGVLNVQRFATRRWPRAVGALLHRNVALLAVVFVGVHVVTAAVDSKVPVGWWASVIPLTSEWNRLWVGLGTLSLDLMIAVVITSLLRARMTYRTWRAVHWLAYASWPLAVVHGFESGTDSGAWWARSVYLLSIAAVLGAVGWRLSRPASAGGPTGAAARALAGVLTEVPPGVGARVPAGVLTAAAGDRLRPAPRPSLAGPKAPAWTTTPTGGRS
jgi:sulfoxide reductase heme-binding subunit YedZ